MSLLKIVHYPDPVLLTPAKPVTDNEFNPELAAVVENMFETMVAAGGVGLAAPQVGISRRLFVMGIPGEDDSVRRVAFINPEVIYQEGEQSDEEGCLSFPGLFQLVKREMRVVVRADDLKGERFEMDLTNLAARCVLHETDHCDGIVFLDRMSPLKRGIAKSKIKRLQKTGKWE